MTYAGDIKTRTTTHLVFETEFIQEGARGRHHLTEAEFDVIRQAAISWQAAQELMQTVLDRVEQRNRAISKGK